MGGMKPSSNEARRLAAHATLRADGWLSTEEWRVYNVVNKEAAIVQQACLLMHKALSGNELHVKGGSNPRRERHSFCAVAI